MANIPDAVKPALNVVFDRILRSAGCSGQAMGIDWGNLLDQGPDSNPTFGDLTADSLEAAAVTSNGILTITAGGADISGSLVARNGVSTNAIGSYGSSVVAINGAPVDGSNAVGVQLGSSTTLSNASAKLLSIKNNTSEKLSVDYAGNLTANNIVTRTTAPIVYYVATTGSDSNAGTIALPFLTIQKALDSVPKFINHPVTINVGAGTFGGFSIAGFVIEKQRSDSEGSWLAVVGTLATATVATGTATGTITTVANGTGSTHGVITDNAQAWTVDDLKGKLIEITVSASVIRQYVIVSNTATAITVAGTSVSLANGQAYTIKSWSTNINTAVNQPRNYAYPAQTTSTVAGLVTAYANSVNKGYTTISVKDLHLDASALTGTSVVYGQSLFGVYQCKITNTNAGGSTGFVVSAGMFILRCYIAMTNNTGYGVWVQGFNGSDAPLTISGCFIEGGNTAVRIDYTCNYMGVGSNLFKGQTQTGLYMNGPLPSSGISGLRIDGAVQGIYYAGLSSASGSPGGCTLLNGNVSNCSVAGIRVEGNSSFYLSGYSGTGNLVGLSLSKGASVAVSASTTLTGTTEVQIDGVNSDLATMRAATPKVINNVTYFSKFFEA